MKRLFLSLAILICASLTISVSAQGERKDGKRGFAMHKELNLTDDQQKKMETLGTDFRSKMKELRDNKDITKEDKETKMKELRDQHMAEVNKILTTEQQTKMKELREKRPQMNNKRPAPNMYAQRGGTNRPMAPRGDRMKDLNLTDAQKDQIKSLNEDFKKKAKELAEQHKEALDKVYTPEQQEKLKEMKKDRPRDGRFAFNGKRGNRTQLDATSKEKLKELTENYQKEKKAVELSRIAPEAQKTKIEELTKKYKEEKRQIIKNAAKTKDKKPA